MDSLRIDDYFVASVLAFISRRAGPAWLVGGFVRDALLGRPIHDLDLIVPEGGIELARAISRAFGGAFFVLDHERDVARTILTRPDASLLNVDVAHLRVPDLGGDLALRDFTINAMAAAVPPATKLPGCEVPLIDPFDGRADLAAGLIRMVYEDAFRDDPLRILRGLRIAVELGLRLEPATCDLMRRDAPLLAHVATERIRDELLRIVGAPGAWQHLRLMASLDLLRPVLPEMAALVGVTQSAPHYLDVFDHTRAVLAHAEGILALVWPAGPFIRPDAARPGELAADQDPIVFAPESQWAALSDLLAPHAQDLRGHLLEPLAAGRARRDLFLWAALAHDWGKAKTRTVGADWRVHFYEHEHRGADLAENRLRLLAFSANEASYVSRMVEMHMRPAHLARHHPATSRAFYRFYRDAGPIGPDITLLALADKMATRGPDSEQDKEFWSHMLSVAGQVFEAYFREHASRVAPAPLLDGRAIMDELGLAPGPQVGRLVEGLREAQAVGEVTTVDEARAWLNKQPSDSDAAS